MTRRLPHALVRHAFVRHALVRPLILAGLAALGLGALPAAASARLGAWHFASAPKLQPPEVRVDVARAGTAPGLVFIDPFKDFAVKTPEVGQPGALILDAKGDPVWFHPVPAGKQLVDLRVQRYLGKPVLTFWLGTISVPPSTALPPGTPEPGAKFYIYSNAYKLIRAVTAVDGWTPDLHEFTLTSHGTAIFPVAKVEQTTLRTDAGSQQVRIVDSGVQEIDLKTGKLVFSWDMLQHVPLSEAQVPVPPAGGVWDPYHMNSVQERGNQLLVSARNTSAIYDVNRSTGRLIWQLGGTGSTFTMGAGASFSWQHDAQFVGSDEVSLFDDACCNLGVPGAKPDHAARGLVLKLNTAAKTATLARAYGFPGGIYVPSQGNMEALANGDEFIGWGQEPYYTEYSAGGKVLYQVTLPAADESYRAFKFRWSATPSYRPGLAAVEQGGRRSVYASWNGATGVRAWRILAGATARALSVAVGRAARTGFETRVPVAAAGPYFRAEALGAGGKVLGRSPTVRLTRPAFRNGERHASAAAASTVMIQTSDHSRELGRILAASNGHALYMFSRDTRGLSTCTGTCAEFWKPLLAGRRTIVKARSGANAKLLGTAKLPGGRLQVTYDKHPLYTYIRERSANSTTGEGASQFGGRWYVLNTKGSPVKPKRNPKNPCNPVCSGY